jgi:hypothetical protein
VGVIVAALSLSLVQLIIVPVVGGVPSADAG